MLIDCNEKVKFSVKFTLYALPQIKNYFGEGGDRMMDLFGKAETSYGETLRAESEET